MGDLPLISVIVPVYKVEAYLDQCVQSIVDQTYPNLEIILVDDGSPDNCGAICDAWAKKDSRIRVIHQENAGAGAARNTALDAARGELIGMIDSDDYIGAEMYSHLYSLMKEDVDLAECGLGTTTGDDFRFDDGSGANVTTVDALTAMRLHIRDEIFCQTPPNKLYRSSAIGDTRFPVGNLIDDEFFTYKVIARCRKLAHSDACMYAYRQQSGSAMHKTFSLKRLQGMEAKQLRLDYLRENMPQLEYEARFDLFFYCMYLMQESLSHLQDKQLEEAKARIMKTAEQLMPLAPNPEASSLKNLLLKMAQKQFVLTCRLLNFLIAIHILK